MKPQITIPLAVAGILATVGTAIANANGFFGGHGHWVYWCWGGSIALLATAIVFAVINARVGRQQDSSSKGDGIKLPASRPIIVPKRYGPGLLKNHMGYTGLAVVNDGEPAYDISIFNVAIETSGRRATLEFQSGHTER